MDLSKLSKEELIKLVGEKENKVKEVEEKLKSKGVSRKDMLYSILEDGKCYSGEDLSNIMSEKCGCVISRRNVSSLLCYLRDDMDSGKIEGKMLVKVGRGVGLNKMIDC